MLVSMSSHKNLKISWFFLFKILENVSKILILFNEFQRNLNWQVTFSLILTNSDSLEEEKKVKLSHLIFRQENIVFNLQLLK